jgi:hypothetical protein
MKYHEACYIGVSSTQLTLQLNDCKHVLYFPPEVEELITVLLKVMTEATNLTIPKKLPRSLRECFAHFIYMYTPEGWGIFLHVVYM